MDTKKTLKFVWHYCKEDKTFCGDYHSVEVFLNSKKVYEYSDDYHEHAGDKIDGFIEGLKYCNIKGFQIKHIQVADKG